MGGLLILGLLSIAHYYSSLIFFGQIFLKNAPIPSLKTGIFQNHHNTKTTSLPF